VAARIKVLLLIRAGVGQQKEPEIALGASPAVADAPEDVYESTAAEAELAIPASDPIPDSHQAVPDEPETRQGEQVSKNGQSVLAPELWLDPDVRWLTGVHDSEGHDYLVRESYEELLWWMQMPSLLRLAGETAPSREALEHMSKIVKEALATAEA
jgi:hypothetical protein